MSSCPWQFQQKKTINCWGFSITVEKHNGLSSSIRRGRTIKDSGKFKSLWQTLDEKIASIAKCVKNTTSKNSGESQDNSFKALNFTDLILML